MKYLKYVIAGIGLGFVFSGCIALAMINDDGAFGSLLIQLGAVFSLMFSVISIGATNEKSTK